MVFFFSGCVFQFQKKKNTIINFYRRFSTHSMPVYAIVLTVVCLTGIKKAINNSITELNKMLWSNQNFYWEEKRSKAWLFFSYATKIQPVSIMSPGLRIKNKNRIGFISLKKKKINDNNNSCTKIQRRYIFRCFSDWDGSNKNKKTDCSH